MSDNQNWDDIAGRIEAIEPLLKELLKASERFAACPSIVNGSRLQDARERLYDALHGTAEDFLGRWGFTTDEKERIAQEFKTARFA